MVTAWRHLLSVEVQELSWDDPFSFSVVLAVDMSQREGTRQLAGQEKSKRYQTAEVTGQLADISPPFG